MLYLCVFPGQQTPVSSSKTGCQHSSSVAVAGMAWRASFLHSSPSLLPSPAHHHHGCSLPSTCSFLPGRKRLLTHGTAPCLLLLPITPLFPSSPTPTCLFSLYLYVSSYFPNVFSLCLSLLSVSLPAYISKPCLPPFPVSSYCLSVPITASFFFFSLPFLCPSLCSTNSGRVE